MDCASCGQTNPPGARFCGGCGTSLANRCPSCETECPAGARFCNGCGTALIARPAADAVSRKVVTIVFADLIGSVSLHERLDAESARRLMDRYHRAMSAAVDVHGGRVVQLLGDGVLAAFGVPRVAEDDAIRAVRAAVGMQRAFRELARDQGAAMESVGLRVAVNTGEIVVSDDENSVMGDPTNVAARLQQEARDGDVLVGEGTQRLVGQLVTLAPLGSFALRGRAETVAAYRVVSLDRPATAQAIAFVGRDEELRRLTAVYDAAVATPAARLAVLLGSPGLGKSRLVAEFTRRAGERATVLAARCDAAGGATFAPLAEALRALLRIDEGAGGDVLRAAIDSVVLGDDAERTRIATGIGALLAGTPAPPEETFFVVRRLLAALAAVRPVVLVIDDLQWAEPLLLDLIEHLVQWSTGTPLLVLVAARPELRETRSSLTTPGGIVSDVVTLTGLDAGAATRLAANVIGGSELPAALAGRVLATSEGNPLFVTELVRMLVQDGTLVRAGDRWITTVEISKLDMPPTIHVLLAARIERLRPEERSVLERAAVIGRQFSRAAVAHLLPRGTSDLDARLEALRRSELIEPDTGWFLGEPALRFHHVLIRDAAYRRVLKETRAELHERFADWIVSRVGEAVEHDETIGWHLEQAHQCLRELGPLGENGKSLGERAARHLGAAGRRALSRDDLALAAGLLGRAIDRLDPEDAARGDLALEWCEALLATGDVGPAARAIDELARLSADSDRLRAWHTCFAGQLAALTDPQSLRATADAVASAAEALASAGDAAGEAKAHSVRAAALARLGEVGACETALDLALAAARRARDRRRANAVLAGAPVAALWGPSPVTRASGRCLDVVRVLRITQGAPAVEAVALRCQAVLETLRGRGEAARRMIASSRRMVEELGIAQQLLESDVFAGMIELLEGDAEAAEQCLRAAYEGLRERGLGIDAARAAALLGRALLAQDRAAEAEALSHESEALAGDDLKAAIAWRGVRAEALALRGDSTTAVELARAAVALAAATDALLDHADARMALATALRTAGRVAEADAEATRALDLWEAKGATLLVERAPRASGASNLVPAGRIEATRSATRRVRPNFASEQMRRLGAALAARDAGALPALWTEDAVIFHHATGLSYWRDAAVGSFSSAFEAATDLSAEYVALATLGASLALGRLRVSAAGVVSGDQSFGAFDNHQLSVMEANASNQAVHVEIFAEHQLGEAVARLYERYAELQPEGRGRDAATTTARTVAVTSGIAGTGDLSEVMAEDVTFVDHRLLGFGTIRGVAALDAGERGFREVTEDRAIRTEEIYALRPDCLLVRVTTSGTDRQSGGRYERPLLDLRIFGADGRVHRREWFDIDREAEALARFEDLTTPQTAARRLQPNAATAYLARLDAVNAARDLAALGQIMADDIAVVHHPTRVEFGRDAALTRFASLYRAEDLVLVNEPCATLGDSLALLHCSTSVSALADDDVDAGFGAIRIDTHVVTEVDAQGRQRRVEIFAEDHLVDALIRLYERYAELLPEGPEAVRAARTAQSFVRMHAGEPPASYMAEAHEFRDHRRMGLRSGHPSASEVAGYQRALAELAEDTSIRLDEILGVRPDAWLVKNILAGRDRRSGGPFEQAKLDLRCFDAEGRLVLSEWWDVDCEAEALARFDALTGERPGAATRGRVRANAATRGAARLEAAIAAHDEAAMQRELAEDYESLHHPTGVLHGRDAPLAAWRELLQARDGVLTFEPLATLGEALALIRGVISHAGVQTGDLDVGAVRSEELVLVAVNPRGEAQWAEIFAEHHLADAIARLYERYAELLPDGPERDRAATTARSIALGLRGIDEPTGAGISPDVEFSDRRRIGMGSARGLEALLRTRRATATIRTDVALRVHDILALRSDAYLVSWTTSGTDRYGGGAFENHFLMLRAYGPDGLLRCAEWFDPDRADLALARFDALTVPHTLARRVRSNAATALLDRMRAANAARDLAALSQLLANDLAAVHHPTLSEFGRDGVVSRFAALYRAEDLVLVNDPIATLGDSLVLSHTSMSVSALADDDIAPAGAVRNDTWDVREVDAQGRQRRIEIFAEDHLADAIARLYERYAALLPDGPERERAAATSHAVAIGFVQIRLAAPLEAEAGLAADIEFVDHRVLGFPSARGAAEVARTGASLRDVADDVAVRVETVLDLRPEGYVVRATLTGTDRVGGGRFERRSLTLRTFGADGRPTRIELFEADRDTDALARFDALTAARASTRRVRENAATASGERLRAAALARDEDAIAALCADDIQVIHHPTGALIEREAGLKRFRMLGRAEGLAISWETFATLGDSLELGHDITSFDHLSQDDLSFGASRSSYLNVIEINQRGQCARVDVFADDRLGDALARLYERHAELLPDGPERTLAAATARSVATLMKPPDDRYGSALSPTVELADHRMLGTWSGRGAEVMLRGIRALAELSADMAVRVDEILDLDPRGYLVRWTTSGTDRAGGGAYERQFLMLCVFGSNGLLARCENFDTDRIGEALARFDAIAAARAVPHRVRPNAATAHAARMDAAVAARDLDAFLALLADDAHAVHHQTGAAYSERESRRAYEQLMLQNESLVFAHEPIATLGDSLALCRGNVSIGASQTEDLPFGASNMDSLVLMEVDASGRRRATEFFALDKLADALCRLFERYAELAPEAAERSSAAMTARAVAAFLPADFDAIAAVIAPDVESVDHRTLGFGSVQGAESYLRALRSLDEVAEDRVARTDDVLAARSDALLVRRTTSGTDRVGGGVFEKQFLQLLVFGPGGRVTRTELFDSGHEAEALARFDALTAEPQEPRFANAAWRVAERSRRAFEARDWDAATALRAPDMIQDDRRSLVGTGPISGEALRSNVRIILAARDLLNEGTLLATRGERLALARVLMRGVFGSGGPVEFEYLGISEIDTQGLISATVMFDLGDLDAAYAELDRRYVAGEGAPFAELLAFLDATREAAGTLDVERLARLLPADFATISHRRFGNTGERFSRDRYVASMAAMREMGVVGRDLRLDHLRLGPRAAFADSVWIGTRDGGEFELSNVMVFQHDGRVVHGWEMFDDEQFDRAIARFDELTAEPPEPRFANAASRAMELLGEAWCAHSIDRVAALLAPEFRNVDRRAMLANDLDRDAFLASFGPLLARPARIESSNELLATRGERLALARVLNRVHPEDGPDGAGPFESEFLLVLEVSTGGLIRLSAVFDPANLDAAYAELDARFAAGEGAPHAAVLAHWGAFRAATNAREWETARALLPHDFTMLSHRRLASSGERLDREQFIRALSWGDDSGVRATLRRDHLRLSARAAVEAVTLAGSADGGAFEQEFVLVFGHDGSRLRSCEAFDLEQLDAAVAHFDAHHQAGEDEAHPDVAAGMREFSRAFAARDWDALAARCAPDIAVHDHRRLGWETLHGPADYVRALRALVELAPDTALRLDHVEMRERGYLVTTVWVGTRDGGAFEEPSLMVAELDAEGRIHRFDQYELERLAEARARYDSIGAAHAAFDPLHIPPNAATRARVRTHEAFQAHDWAAMRAQVSDDFVFEDRGKRALLRGDVELWIASAQQSASPGVRREAEIVATLGDRIALERILYGGAPGGVEYEKETLRLTELDAGGRIRASITFDADDRRAASVDLFERYARSDAGGWTPPSLVEWVRAQNDHDLDRVRTVLPDDFVFHDRRRTGVGRLASAREFVASLAALFEQCSDAWMEILYVLDAEKHAHLSVGKTSGTLIDGGAFESVYLRLLRFEGDRCVGAELFELEDLDRARARFEELRPDPLRIPPNAATRVAERWKAAAAALDWDTLESLFSPDFQFEDRRRGIRDSGDRAKMFASFRVAMAAGTRVTAETLATAGDRLVLEGIHFAIYDGDALVAEIDTLQVMELDATGRVVAIISVDPDDRRAAAAEMFERFYTRTEEGRRTPANHVEFTRALFAHDRARMRAALPDEFSFHDHRRTGIGPGGSADDYVAWMGAATEQSDDLAVETLHHAAIAEHGTLSLGRAFGTLRDGGAFESVNLRISRYEDGRWVGVESFEPGDLARARARFEELGREYAARRADPQGARLESRGPRSEPKASEVDALAIPPNGAVRVGARVAEIVASRDWAALRALASVDFEFDDRQRRALVRGGIDLYVRNLEFVRAWSERRVSPTLLATVGDRVFLDRIAYVGESDGSVFEGEFLRVVEIDAEGKLRAVLHFDADARRAASVELSDRYFRSEEARSFPAASAVAIRALIDHDLERFRAVLPDDFVLDDHRRTGLGRIEGAALFTQSMAALFEQAPDLVLEPLYTIAVGEYGALEMAHMFGTLAASGGDVESVYVRLFVYRDDRMIGMELFEPEDLDVARARFAELGAARAGEA